MRKINVAFLEINPPYIVFGQDVKVDLVFESKNKEKAEKTTIKVSILGTDLPLFFFNEAKKEATTIEIKTEVTNRWKKYSFPLVFRLKAQPAGVAAVMIQLVVENESGGVASELTNVVCQ